MSARLPQYVFPEGSIRGTQEKTPEEDAFHVAFAAESDLKTTSKAQGETMKKSRILWVVVGIYSIVASAEQPSEAMQNYQDKVYFSTEAAQPAQEQISQEQTSTGQGSEKETAPDQPLPVFQKTTAVAHAERPPNSSGSGEIKIADNKPRAIAFSVRGGIHNFYEKACQEPFV